MARYPGFEKDARFVREMLDKHLSTGCTVQDVSINSDLLADPSKIPLEPKDKSFMKWVEAQILQKTGQQPSRRYTILVKDNIILMRIRNGVAKERGENPPPITWEAIALNPHLKISRNLNPDRP